MSGSFGKVATVSCSTKRATMSDGKLQAPTEHLTSLSCTPLDPLSMDIQARMELSTPYEALQTFLDGSLDIEKGDVLVVGSEEYNVLAVHDWTWGGSEYLHLVIEELKR